MKLIVEDLSIEFSNHHLLQFASETWHFDKSTRLYLIRGENGSGKTSYLNVLSGYLRPKKGHALIGETRISGRGPSWASTHGIVRSFQNPLMCNELTVWENIALPLFNAPLKRASTYRQMAEEQLLSVGFLELVELSPAELSFGQRRIVELLRIRTQVQNTNAPLLLLDEPFSGLDPVRQEKARDIVNSFLESGAFCILVEHTQGTGGFAYCEKQEVVLTTGDDGIARFCDNSGR
jgi:ABC-type branched-subunit amino acid transport system ATPase component